MFGATPLILNLHLFAHYSRTFYAHIHVWRVAYIPTVWGGGVWSYIHAHTCTVAARSSKAKGSSWIECIEVYRGSPLVHAHGRISSGPPPPPNTHLFFAYIPCFFKSMKTSNVPSSLYCLLFACFLFFFHTAYWEDFSLYFNEHIEYVMYWICYSYDHVR